MGTITKVTLGIPGPEGNLWFLLGEPFQQVRDKVYSKVDSQAEFMSQCTFTKADGYEIVINTSLILIIEQVGND